MWVHKASNVTRGFQKPPLEGFNLERSQCNVLLIVLLQFGDNEAGEYFSFSSCLDWALYHTSQGVSPDISLSRNKQSYYWVRQASERKSMPGALETSSDSPLFTSDCHASLFFREYDCCLTLNVTMEIIDSLVGVSTRNIAHVNENLCFATGSEFWRRIDLSMYSKCGKSVEI